MKKFMSIMLTMGLMASSMSLGFAATDVAKEIEDKDVKDAVERLAAFGIVNGMEDGKYHEELKVTREQFAKILVTALGLDSAAIQGPTQFADVEAGRWSSGYVNVAVGQGILKGYPDGTFQPTKEVSYGEAVTMLVRALGYKDDFLPGQWPANYIAKAADLDITDDVKFASSGTANRGDVAIMVNNTLDAEVIKVLEYGTVTTYENSEKTLIQDKLDLDIKEDQRILATNRLNDGMKTDEIEFSGLGEKELDSKTNFSIADAEQLIGENTKVYLNDDKEIVYVEGDEDGQVVYDYVETALVDGKIELYVKDDKYAFKTNSEGDAYTLYINGESKDDSDITAHMMGKFVIDNDKIVYADLFNPEASGNGFIVTKVDEKDKTIEGYLGDDESAEINLNDYDKVFYWDKDRNPMEIGDLKADDVLYVAKFDVDGDEHAYVTVVRETAEGKLERTKTDEVRIGGKDIDVNANATFSADGNDKIEDYSLSNENLEDLDDQQVKAILGYDGRVLHMSGDSDTTSGFQYGLVLDAWKTDSQYIKVQVASKEGIKEVTYKLESNSDMGILDMVDGNSSDEYSEDADRTLVKFKLNSDGEIAEHKMYAVSRDGSKSNAIVYHDGDAVVVKETTSADTDMVEDFYAVSGTTATSDEFKTVGTFKGLNIDKDDTLIVDAKDFDNGSDFDDDDTTLVKWADVEDDKVDSESTYFAFVDKTGEAEIMIFGDEGLDKVGSDYEAVYVIDTGKKGSDVLAEIKFADGSKREIVIDSYPTFTPSSLKDFSEGLDQLPVIGKVSSDGKFDIVKASNAKVPEFDVVSGVVYDKEGSNLKIGDTWYKIGSDAIFYEEDESRTKGSIVEDKTAVYAITKDNVLQVIELMKSGETEETNVKAGTLPATEYGTLE